MCSSKAQPKNKTILEMRNICKSFAGVQVLFDVNFDLKEAEVHALVGENGAGKTTLMNILNGVLSPDKGKIFLKGKEQKIQTPRQAQDMGIAFIHQELNLIDPLSVKENIYLGREPKKRTGLLNWEELKKRTSELFSHLGLNIDPDEKIENLKMADQQMVEIAKALSFDAYIIVMDEPTSSLTKEETEKLFGIIQDLKKKGCSIIYISHRLEEIFEIADRVTVLRN